MIKTTWRTFEIYAECKRLNTPALSGEYTKFGVKQWVSLDEHNKLKDKFTIKQVCRKCGGKAYCPVCDKKGVCSR